MASGRRLTWPRVAGALGYTASCPDGVIDWFILSSDEFGQGWAR